MKKLATATMWRKAGAGLRRAMAAVPGIALSGAMLLAGACSSDNEAPAEPILPVDDTVEITINVPGQEIPDGMTRSSMDGYLENKVEKVDVIVFDASVSPQRFLQHASGDEIAQDTSGPDINKVRFKVKLDKRTQKVAIMVVANAQTEVASAVSGAVSGTTLKTTILEALIYVDNTISGANPWAGTVAGTEKPLPMAGEYESASGLSTGTAYNVNLRRMLARVDIKSTVPTSKFTIEEVVVANIPRLGRIAPAWDANGVLSQTSPTAVNIPAGGSNKYFSWQGYGYNLSPSNDYSGWLYLFESRLEPSAHNNTCLLVKGKYYDGSVWTPGWYRVDFVEGKDSAGKAPGDAGFDPTKVSYMPILRNYKYSFTITEVNGKGCAFQNEARDNPGVLTGLRTELLTVDESGVKDYVYNGQNYLGISESLLQLDETNVVTTSGTIMTDVDAGWEIDTSKGVNGVEYIDGSGWIQSLTKIGSAIKGVLDILPSTNNTSAERKAYIHIKAGRLAHKILVVQDEAPLDYTNTGTPWFFFRRLDSSGDVTFGNAPQTCPKGYRLPTRNEAYILAAYRDYANINFVADDMYHTSTTTANNTGKHVYRFSSNPSYSPILVSWHGNVRCVKSSNTVGQRYPYVDLSQTNGPVIVSQEVSGDGVRVEALRLSVMSITTNPSGLASDNINSRAYRKIKVAIRNIDVNGDYNDNYVLAGSSSATYSKAINACANSYGLGKLGQSNWRIPSDRELMLIWAMGGGAAGDYVLDDTDEKYDPSIDTNNALHDYPGFVPLQYSNSSYYFSFVHSSNTFWKFTPYLGVFTTTTSINSHIRCVRDV